MEPTFAFVIPVGGKGPVDPGFGHPGGGWSPTDPGFGGGIPVPPPGIWGPPPRPDQGLPPVPPGGHIDNSLPVVPGIPVYPTTGPISPGSPDNTLPLPPGTVWPPLPPQFTGTVLALVVVFGIGYRWVVIDTDLRPDNALPPTATPK